MITAAVDPGTKVCAVALFDDSVLTVTWFESFEGGPPAIHVDHVVVEKPQFDSRVSKHVIDLAWMGALVAASFGAPVTAYTPSQWKKSVAKPVHHHRIWQVLTPAERAVFPEGTEARIAEACRKGGLDNWRKSGAEYYGRAKGSDVHNYLDACALGLHHLGRYSETKGTSGPK
jgi:hypothetical protein